MNPQKNLTNFTYPLGTAYMGSILCALLSSSNKLSTDGLLYESFKVCGDGLVAALKPPWCLSRLEPYRALLKSWSKESNSDKFPPGCCRGKELCGVPDRDRDPW